MLISFMAVALIGVLVFMRDNQKGADQGLDWAGFLALAVAITTLQLMLDRGGLHPSRQVLGRKARVGSQAAGARR